MQCGGGPKMDKAPRVGGVGGGDRRAAVSRPRHLSKIEFYPTAAVGMLVSLSPAAGNPEHSLDVTLLSVSLTLKHRHDQPLDAMRAISRAKITCVKCGTVCCSSYSRIHRRQSTKHCSNSGSRLSMLRL